MHAFKRQRVQASTLFHVAESSSLQAELAKDLPLTVLGDVVAALLADPASRQHTQSVIERCRKEHGCTLEQQMQQLVEQSVKEPDENFCRKMGSLADSMSDLDSLLRKAEQWAKLKGYAAAFELVWACVERGSDWEERGSDGDGWVDWDSYADSVLLPTLDHMAACWTMAELDEQIARMEGFQESGAGYGCDTVFQQSLPKLKELKASHQA